ncbi:MAG: MBL fold metallo-hydrolase [Candidatus Altiarchaeota archaeon]
MAKVLVDVLKEGTRVDAVVDGVWVSKAICSAVVLLRTAGHSVVVDPGAMGYADEVLRQLKEKGVEPGDVDIVVNTHLHLDHTYNNYLFSNAVIYTPTSIWHIDKGNKVEMFSHMTDPHVPGITFLATPGHMDKHISVLAKTDRGRIVIAGDAIRQELIESGKKPDRYQNPDMYVASMRRIFEVADVIVPGHGPVIKGERLKALKKKLDSFKD